MKASRILVPVDLSPGSRAALKDAATWAKRTGASLRVLHVHLPVPPALFAASGMVLPPLDPAQAARLRETVERELASFVEGALGRGHGADLSVEEGIFVPETVVESAQKHRDELLCFSAHGRRGFRHLLLGSTAEAILRLSPLPSLVLRYADDRAPAPSLRIPRTVLACVDLSDRSRGVLAHAASLVDPKGTLVVAHVIEGPASHGLYGAALDLPAENLAAAREWVQAALTKLLGEIGGDAKKKIRVAFDRPARGILALKEELKPDLTVIGTRGPQGGQRLLLGSVAERVIRQAVGPVFVVPAP
ncbi:MAG: universal stress protein [Planctomycetaceae bacterium]